MINLFNKIAFVLIAAIPVVLTLAYGTVHPPFIAMFYLIVVVLLLALSADAFVGGSVVVSRSYLQIPLVAFGVFAVIQAIPFGTYSENGIDQIPRTISLEPFATQVSALHILALAGLFGACLVLINSASRLRRIVTFLIIFGFAYAFFAILQSVMSPEAIYGIYRPEYAIPFGSFVNKHDFAAIIELLIGLPLGLLFAGSLKPERRLLVGVAVALMGAAMFLSGSRGGLVALLAEVIILTIVTTRALGGKALIAKGALSAALIVAALGGALFVGGDTSLTRFAESAASGDVTSSRFQIWNNTLKIIARNFPLGAGIGAFPQAYTQVDPTGGVERVEQAHNDYLQIVADAGIVGLILGGAFLFLFIRQGVRSTSVRNKMRRGMAAGAFAGASAVLVHSLFDFVLHITAVSAMFLTILAIMVACGREYADDSDDSPPREGESRRRNVTPIDRREQISLPTVSV